MRQLNALHSGIKHSGIKRYDDVKILWRSMEESEVWKILDKHNRGYVTLREIYEILGEESEDETKITYEDLKTCLNDAIPEEECLNAFNFFDTTDSGKVTRNDIKKSMKKLGEELSEEELLEMLSDLGLDDKEHLTYEEFKKFIT